LRYMVAHVAPKVKWCGVGVDVRTVVVRSFYQFRALSRHVEANFPAI
jgi:hypothetical protein